MSTTDTVTTTCTVTLIFFLCVKFDETTYLKQYNKSKEALSLSLGPLIINAILKVLNYTFRVLFYILNFIVCHHQKLQVAFLLQQNKVFLLQIVHYFYQHIHSSPAVWTSFNVKFMHDMYSLISCISLFIYTVFIDFSFFFDLIYDIALIFFAVLYILFLLKNLMIEHFSLSASSTNILEKRESNMYCFTSNITFYSGDVLHGSGKQIYF